MLRSMQRLGQVITIVVVRWLHNSTKDSAVEFAPLMDFMPEVAAAYLRY